MTFYDRALQQSRDWNVTTLGLAQSLRLSCLGLFIVVIVSHTSSRQKLLYLSENPLTVLK